MKHTSQVEIERKYDVDESALVPTFTSVEGIENVSVDETVTLEAVYYDTDGFDLLRRRHIVRRREGGGDEGWHIKRPAAEGRAELHWPLDVDAPAGGEDSSDASAVPDSVLEPVRAIVRDRILIPVARISTRRTATHLLAAGGEAVAEFADDVVTASDVRGGSVRVWREWEMELLPGAPDSEQERTALLDALEVAVLAEAATVSSSPAKIARALGQTSVAELLPETAAAPLTSKSPAADVIVEALRQLVEQLEQLDPEARADQPDAVHRMRSTVRRLRSVLAAYSRLFDAQRVDSLRDQLRSLGAVLGTARDAEVRAQLADDELSEIGHRVDDASRRRLVEGSIEEYRQAHQAALRMLSSASYYRLFDALDEFVANPPLSERGEKRQSIKVVAAKVIASELARLRKRAGAAAFAGASGSGGAVDARGDQALHSARKAARRLRFAADAVSQGGTAVLGKKYRHISREAERVQDALGDHRDSALFVEHLLLTSNRAHAEGENTFVYGAMTVRAQHRGAAALNESPKALKRLDRRAESL
ncbi:CYTH and CHAD domain-containing protein [Agreia sp. PsM10]|uniref:CYTH and CHAD domain-containing protein n=1 Tax=Agreia sp. PsM10 TaxID=3030533 RepID=UPI00263B60AF|nr:CYTH and CHAD domain-containing protein [Agreia sp. PsM10]MDN4640975.1 CYTH and CHAD domain-containing protein [Agreia sp. PsM10]